jgi:eukaryotic-like serine/threonine-protein kinase
MNPDVATGDTAPVLQSAAMAGPRDDDVTMKAATRGAAPTAQTPGPPPGHQFAPGAIVAGRYRLVALLGRGGMGEVYRADDLTLDQPVALKFLPQSDGHDPVRLAQLHNELRVARQVSHKNVCRLYDLGDADGRRFITMEYVDGEDLASSLRRFGRIPPDKAVQIARQLCAGVAAAHERGVLHRDLKPANVMLDGNGDVRITDFGIATVAAEAGGDISGTPQYMAPELFAGQAASTRSDIYALGLVVYEVFTGRRAHDASSLAELKTLHEKGAVTTPSMIVRDLDPAVERVILRCLEKDPDRRPASALSVAAALPGGDPLAAALAAGETPSPDMLAAAAETDALAVLPAAAATVAAIVGLLVFAGMSAHTSIVGRVPLDKAPAVLADRAEQILVSVGHTNPPGDRAHGVSFADDYLQWLRDNRPTPDRWAGLSSGSPPAVLFWYRSSPRAFYPIAPALTIQPDDPPATESDMRHVVLDTQGRLQELHVVPPQLDATTTAPAEPPWARLFEAAGLSMTAFTPAAPQWTPPDFADTRMAWDSVADDTSSSVRVRVEAAAYRGRPVSFAVVRPWTRPTRMQPPQDSAADRVFAAVVLGLLLAIMAAAALLARHNLRGGRADRRAAWRMVVFVWSAYAFAWLVLNHHVADMEGEVSSIQSGAAIFTLVAAVMWLMYIAAEPYVRRFWPDSLLGWSRLVSGHVRDPRVGRDVLRGALVGIALSLNELAKARVLPALGYPAPVPSYGVWVETLASPTWLAAVWAAGSVRALQAALTLLLCFVVLRLLLRRAWLVSLAGGALLSLLAVNRMGGTGTILIGVFPIITGVLMTFVIVRFGLLALAIMMLVYSTTSRLPVTLDVSAWYSVNSNWTLVALVALFAFGFYASRAGQPVFGSMLNE